MERLRFSAGSAILWGGLVAGILDLSGVYAFWAIKQGVPLIAILQSIATSRLGEASFQGGINAALIGLTLHFAVSFVFAAGYVVTSSRMGILRSRPVLFGLLYGLLAWIIMTFIVVPQSRATFGDLASWPPPLINLSASVFIHLILFGLPIALAASRINLGRYSKKIQADAQKGSGRRLALSPAGAILWGGLAAGIIEIAAVFIIWHVTAGAGPVTILQSIASSVLGQSAFQGGMGAAALGLLLHFLVSFAFAAGYVAASSYANVMRYHAVIFGIVYGFIVHWIMSTIVVPLSLAKFGAAGPPPPPDSYALTLIIHTFLFGLPITLAASRIRRSDQKV